MNRRTRWALGAILLPALLAAAGAPRLARAAESGTTEARKAAEQWLALVDAGKYGESWDQAAQSLRQSLSRKAWESALKKKLPPLGKVESRKLVKADVLKNIPGLPPGEYVGLQYRTSFQKSQSTAEVVVAVLGKDGKWRVLQYTVQPIPSEGAASHQP